MSVASVTIDGITYPGERSVRQDVSRVWIDGKEVGVEVEVDVDGHRLPEPATRLPFATVARRPWLRLFR